jgi:hypothetical protein
MMSPFQGQSTTGSLLLEVKQSPKIELEWVTWSLYPSLILVFYNKFNTRRTRALQRTDRRMAYKPAPTIPYIAFTSPAAVIAENCSQASATFSSAERRRRAKYSKPIENAGDEVTSAQLKSALAIADTTSTASDERRPNDVGRC